MERANYSGLISFLIKITVDNRISYGLRKNEFVSNFGLDSKPPEKISIKIKL